MPNLACFNIAIFSIISALSVGPAVKLSHVETSQTSGNGLAQWF